MTVDFLRLTVAFQQATKDSHASDPEQLLWHTGVGRTFPLAKAAVTSLTTSLSVFANTGTRVDSHGFLDDQTILDEFADVLPYRESHDIRILVRRWNNYTLLT